jgi:hypothetical protein
MDSVRIDKKQKGFLTGIKIRPLNIIIMVLGGLLGFAFYYYTKCCTDDMTIHISPYVSVFYGLIFGALISYRSRR